MRHKSGLARRRPLRRRRSALFGWSFLCICALACAAAGAARAEQVDWDFSSASGLTLNGSVRRVHSQDGDVLRLTPAASWQSGSAFSSRRIGFGAKVSFSTYFQFRFSQPGGLDAADGIVFVIQPVSASLGSAGSGIGYQGIPHSIGIEFDTFNNGAEIAENDDNHVAVDTNGRMQNLHLVNPYGVTQCHRHTVIGKHGCMANGKPWSVWIDYDGATLAVAVAEDSTTRPPQNLLTMPIDLAQILGSREAFVGFTAATGSGFENHDVIGWRYSSAYRPIAGPASVAPQTCAGCIIP